MFLSKKRLLKIVVVLASITIIYLLIHFRSTPNTIFSETITDSVINQNDSIFKIGFGMALTTRTMTSWDDIKVNLPFFKVLMPSFCETCDPEFYYKFFICYDYCDAFLVNDSFRNKFIAYFNSVIYVTNNSSCKTSIEFFWSNYTRTIARSQNDALMEAYKQNMDYLYMINDDTIMKSKHWTRDMVNGLLNMYPKNVGVVGPDHVGGNLEPFTYHMVHRTHIEIFTYFYPRIFTDWYADEWITYVYERKNSRRLQSVPLIHTMEKGTRYTEDRKLSPFLKIEVLKGRATLKKYLIALNVNTDVWFQNLLHVY